MTALTIQESSVTVWNLLNSLAEQKASVTHSFLSVLNNGTSWILRSKIYHPFPDLKFWF